MDKKNKIGILTQPLHDNYGGLLQALALSKMIEKLGHEPYIINRRSGHSNNIRKFLSNIKRKITGSKRYVPTPSERAVISKHTLAFRNKYFPNLTQEILTNKKLQELNKQNFNAFVVGSDQCWRPRYSPNIFNYFLDFAKDQPNIKRVAYAASFGTAEWEFMPEQTEVCKELVQKFDAVSVREDSAVDLCVEHLDANATHVLDPTMLWDKSFYNKLVDSGKVDSNGGNLKAYVLDKNEEKSNAIKYLEETLGLKAFEVMPSKRLNIEKPDNNLLDYQYPSPLQWLKGYQDAKFVIADSFHGIVFSILYNIPFLAIGNEKRGLTRFTSLLKMFQLEDRLIVNLSKENINHVLKKDIDWSSVNNILDVKRKESIDFLKNNL